MAAATAVESSCCCLECEPKEETDGRRTGVGIEGLRDTVDDKMTQRAVGCG